MRQHGIRGMYKAAHGSARYCLKSGDVAGFFAMVDTLRKLTGNWDTGLAPVSMFRLGKIVKASSGEIACYRLDGPYLSGRRFLRRI